LNSFERFLLYAVSVWVLYQIHDGRKRKTPAHQAAVPIDTTPSDELERARQQFRRENPKYGTLE